MNPLEQAHDAIRRFLAASREPVLLEPGAEPLRLRPDNFLLELTGGRLTLQAWDDAQNIVRRVAAVAAAQPGRLELSVERFGKRAGSLLLLDRRSARNHDGDRQASRLSFREQFRRRLRRQFPQWRLAELSTAADLEHSLSPSYPRALMVKGATAWACIGAVDDGQDPAAALTFGLVWLDYLRRREKRMGVEGLALFLPAGRERVAALRLQYLNPRAAQFALFIHGEAGEERVDLADYGNLQTSLTRCLHPPGSTTRIGEWLERIASECAEAELVARHDGSLSLRVRGLEFARATGDQLLYGIETARPATASNLAEVSALGSQLARLRSAEAAGGNPLYRRNAEGWLESQVRGNVQEIEATLRTAPIYGQVPAFTAGDRDVIDLLAADRDGRLAVIELKASEDIHLPLQALDYWMRVKWHAARGEFAGQGYFPGMELRRDPPRLLLVAPALDFHPANEVVLRYFSSDIKVERIGVGLEWRKRLKVMFRY